MHERLVQLRKKRKLTQAELADRVGITRSALSQYEIGSRSPDYEIVQRIANFFDVSIDYLVGGASAPTNPLHIMDFANDEIITEPVYYKGMELTTEEKKELIAIIRAILDARQAVK